MERLILVGEAKALAVYLPKVKAGRATPAAPYFARTSAVCPGRRVHTAVADFLRMTIDKVKFEQALNHECQQPYFEQFATKYGRDQLDQPRLAARLAELPATFDVRDILPPLSEATMLTWSAQTLWLTKLARAATTGAAELPELRIEGDYEPAHPPGDYFAVTLIPGNLTVTGNLLAKANLVVLGSVHVHGAWVDTYMNVINCVIAGDLTVGHSLLSEGSLGVGGQLTAPFISLQYNQGVTLMLGGCQARLLIEQDHIGSKLFGPVGIPYLVINKLRLESGQPFMTDVNELLPHAAELFQPKFAAPFVDRYAAVCIAEEQDNEDGPDPYELADELSQDFSFALHEGFLLENPAVFRQ